MISRSFVLFKGVPLANDSTKSGSLVTRFHDPDIPYVDLIQCERDCMRCSYAVTLDCDGNCGACPRQHYCPCVNPAKLRSRPLRPGDIELPVIGGTADN